MACFLLSSHGHLGCDLIAHYLSIMGTCPQKSYIPYLPGPQVGGGKWGTLLGAKFRGTLNSPNNQDKRYFNGKKLNKLANKPANCWFWKWSFQGWDQGEEREVGAYKCRGRSLIWNFDILFIIGFFALILAFKKFLTKIFTLIIDFLFRIHKYCNWGNCLSLASPESRPLKYWRVNKKLSTFRNHDS